MKKYICVFCGSDQQGSVKYKDAAETLGKAIVNSGYGLVYGGGNVGLMKILADSVKAAGSHVIGVVTPEVIKLGVVQENIEVITQPSYSARKAKMASLADGFIALPGGFGTLDELSEIAINNQFASYVNAAENPVKPLIILNLQGFYNGFKLQVETCLKEGFIKQNHYEMLAFESEPLNAVLSIKNFKSPAANSTRWWEKPKDEKSISNISSSSWFSLSTMVPSCRTLLVLGFFATIAFAGRSQKSLSSISSAPKNYCDIH